MKKEQAIEILDGLGYDPFRTDLERIEALATAGAFTDGADDRDEILEAVWSYSDLDVEHTIQSHAISLPEAYRRACAALDKAKDIGSRRLLAKLEEPSRPVAVGSKARAEEILDVQCGNNQTAHAHMFDFLAALDSAQFFADEATIAEIDKWTARAVEVLNAQDHDRAQPHPDYVREVLFRLATAVRKLGIGGNGRGRDRNRVR